MSDQLFVGRSPKSPIGKEIFFYSMDLWIGLHRCLVMLIDEDFPPYPSMDAETAEVIADMLDRRLEFGLVKAYYELAVARRSSRKVPPGKRRGLSREDREHVALMVEQTREYVAFLRDSGGCDAG